MYAHLRTYYGLPSQLACSVERQVAASYKGLWTKLLKNQVHRRDKSTKKRFKGLDQPPHYSSATVQYTYQRDYTFQRDSRVSLGTLDGRVVIPYQGKDSHIALIRQSASIGDAKLWYDKPKKTFNLLVSLQIEVPEPRCEQFDEVVGVDVGMRYLAVTSTRTGKASFHPGKRVRHIANHYTRLHKRLQQKGTRGAKRRLRRIAQRERRLKLQANHIIAKHIIRQRPHTLIGLDCLTDIRARKRRRKRKRKQNGNGSERVSPRARHPPIACIRGGLLPNCKPSTATRRRSPDRWPSKWMPITPRKPARCAATDRRRIDRRKGCCSCATTPSAATGCMPIWLAQEM